LKAIKKLSSRIDREDSDAIHRALIDAKEEGGGTPLKRTRRKAREDAWRAGEMLQDVSTPNTTTLQPTLVSKGVESLPWEVLE
jgi:hypothetical protein